MLLQPIRERTVRTLSARLPIYTLDFTTEGNSLLLADKKAAIGGSLNTEPEIKRARKATGKKRDRKPGSKNKPKPAQGQSTST
jgi:hypothetical protein